VGSGAGTGGFSFSLGRGVGREGGGRSANFGDPASTKALDHFPDLSPYPLGWESAPSSPRPARFGDSPGIPGQDLQPDQPITRLEGALLIYRALAFLGKLLPLENPRKG